MKNKLRVIIQGEVIIRELEKDRKTKEALNKTGIVATGETGNPHQIVGGKYELYGNIAAANNLLKVIDTVELRHGLGANSGHETAIIEPGVYEIIPQREVDIFTRRARNVVD